MDTTVGKELPQLDIKTLMKVYDMLKTGPNTQEYIFISENTMDRIRNNWIIWIDNYLRKYAFKLHWSWIFGGYKTPWVNNNYGLLCYGSPSYYGTPIYTSEYLEEEIDG